MEFRGLVVQPFDFQFALKPELNNLMKLFPPKLVSFAAEAVQFPITDLNILQQRLVCTSDQIQLLFKQGRGFSSQFWALIDRFLEQPPQEEVVEIGPIVEQIRVETRLVEAFQNFHKEIAAKHIQCCQIPPQTELSIFKIVEKEQLVQKMDQSNGPMKRTEKVSEKTAPKQVRFAETSSKLRFSSVNNEQSSDSFNRTKKPNSVHTQKNANRTISAKIRHNQVTQPLSIYKMEEQTLKQETILIKQKVRCFQKEKVEDYAYLLDINKKYDKGIETIHKEEEKRQYLENLKQQHKDFRDQKKRWRQTYGAVVHGCNTEVGVEFDLQTQLLKEADEEKARAKQKYVEKMRQLEKQRILEELQAAQAIENERIQKAKQAQEKEQAEREAKLALQKKLEAEELFALLHGTGAILKASEQVAVLEFFEIFNAALVEIKYPGHQEAVFAFGQILSRTHQISKQKEDQAREAKSLEEHAQKYRDPEYIKKQKLLEMAKVQLKMQQQELEKQFQLKQENLIKKRLKAEEDRQKKLQDAKKAEELEKLRQHQKQLRAELEQELDAQLLQLKLQQAALDRQLGAMILDARGDEKAMREIELFKMEINKQKGILQQNLVLGQQQMRRKMDKDMAQQIAHFELTHQDPFQYSITNPNNIPNVQEEFQKVKPKIKPKSAVKNTRPLIQELAEEEKVEIEEDYAEQLKAAEREKLQQLEYQEYLKEKKKQQLMKTVK